MVANTSKTVASTRGTDYCQRIERRADRRAELRGELRADRRAERPGELRADRRADRRGDRRADLCFPQTSPSGKNWVPLEGCIRPKECSPTRRDRWADWWADRRGDRQAV